MGSPVLFYTIGYPGSGKTTLASRLSFWLDGVHLRADKIGLELFRFPTYSPAERAAVHQEMQRQAGEYLKTGRHVVYDAATNAAAQRAQVVGLASRHGAEAIGLWIDVPADLAKRRAGRARDSGLAGPVVRVIPPAIFDQYVAAFEAPSPSEPVLRLSGDANFSLQYRRLQRQLGPALFKLPRLIQ